MIASPAELRDDIPKAWLEEAIGHRVGNGVMTEARIPKMPTVRCDNTHRKKIGPSWLIPACVARPVTKKEAAGNQDCLDASAAEWKKLLKREVFKIENITEWSLLASQARKAGKTIHLGRIFGIMVEKNSELEPEFRKMKYRVVFQGNNVVTQNWEIALFQDLGSSPASMEAGKAVDAYGCMVGHDIEQADAEQAYVQAYLEGEETWIHLCDKFHNHPDYWSTFHYPDGKKTYNRPCVRLIKALY